MSPSPSVVKMRVTSNSLTIKVLFMEFGDLDRVGNGSGRGNTFPVVSCTICLDIITDNGDRSSVKLQCGHQFHLDCIGSAFNAKGAMQCPNCRETERGQWLYSNGSRSHAGFNIEDLVHDANPYDSSNATMRLVVAQGPLHGFVRLPTSFDRGVLLPIVYDGLRRQHVVLVQPTAVSPAYHLRPYAAYSGTNSSSSHFSRSVSNGSTLSSRWNSRTAPTSSHIDGPDQPFFPSMTQSVARDNISMPRLGSFVHPSAVDHGTDGRAGISVATSMRTPYPDSAARSRERMLALQAYYQHPPVISQGVHTPLLPPTRESNGQMNMTQVEPGAASSEQASGFPSTSLAGRNHSETQNSMPNPCHAWEREQSTSLPSSGNEREPIRVPSHELLGAPNAGVRPANIR
ncbi:E3 ubiquitin-protein ligase IPI1 isoform X1 [Daucus carota subsp. sativus]|uniref:E3 ubiquitin-protein ligase IPI1 isoform X1 n=1 Tax=Daucus carota subsp. sativus TaxID=79200 RepID=UPI0007EF8BC9|nr:PREDICTED: uncharacterized protein LOC108224516 isoform X1 [Daucus carota subsp. sativus]